MYTYLISFSLLLGVKLKKKMYKNPNDAIMIDTNSFSL